MLCALMLPGIVLADSLDIYYDLGSIYTREPASPARTAASPYIVAPATAQNAIFYDRIYGVTTGDYDFRLLFVDSVNDVVNQTIIPNDFSGLSYYEVEVSPLGGSGVFIDTALQQILFTNDSGLTWFPIFLPTSATHTRIESASSYSNMNLATFDSLGYLQIAYFTRKSSGTVDYWQLNRVIFDSAGNQTQHDILATQDRDSTQPLLVEFTKSYDKTFLLARPSDSWVDSAAVAHKYIPKIYVFDDATQGVVESTHIGTFPSDPNADRINRLMGGGAHGTSNNLTTDGHALFTLTRGADTSDAFGTKERAEIRRFEYNTTDEFFPDHGSAGGNMPLCDLTQLPSFDFEPLMDRTISGTYTGWIEHFAAKWSASSPDLSVDVLYHTPDDFENANLGTPWEYKVVRITDPNNASASYSIDLARNDIKCGALAKKKNPIYCLINSDRTKGTFFGIEDGVVASFDIYLSSTSGAYADYYTIDIS